MSDPVAWRHASTSYGGGNCVDVGGAYRMASGSHWGVWVTDSHAPHSRRLYIMRDHWAEFIRRVKDDRV